MPVKKKNFVHVVFGVKIHGFKTYQTLIVLPF